MRNRKGMSKKHGKQKEKEITKTSLAARDSGKENTKKRIAVEHAHVRQGTMFNSSRQPKHVSLVYLIGQFEVPSSKAVKPNVINYFIVSNVLYLAVLYANASNKR